MFFKQVLLIVFINTVHIQSQSTDVIKTKQGQVQGVRYSQSEAFYGIPYADCPQRFAPVKKPSKWSGVFQATTFGPGCYQNCTSFPSGCPANISECCFTLNVYRSSNLNKSSKVSVMVHFHGGDYVSGAGSSPLLNATRLVELNNNIIVITCNYRLQAFGFYFNLDDQKITAPGNVALLDQQQCLRWIQINIVSFGGNPSDVTMWGQSAGASSVGFHLQYQTLYPKRPRLFHKALFESWPVGIQPRTLKQSKRYNRVFAKLAGCAVINVTACLRNKTADEILRASLDVRFDVLTYLDKLITIGLPWQATLNLRSFNLRYNNIDFINRYASKITIPIIWGTNKDEGTLFISEAIPSTIRLPAIGAEIIVSALWHPQNTEAISKLYNITLVNSNVSNLTLHDILTNPSSLININIGGVTTDYHAAVAQALGDYAFHCPLRNMSRALALAGHKKVYSYVFDYIMKANGTLYGSSNWAPECYTRVCHKSEVPFVFNPAGVPTILFTNDEENFAQLMGKYWTNYGKTGDPNSPEAVSPTWNAFQISTNSSLNLTLGDSNNILNYLGSPYCDFWDALQYIF